MIEEIFEVNDKELSKINDRHSKLSWRSSRQQGMTLPLGVLNLPTQISWSWAVKLVLKGKEKVLCNSFSRSIK